LGISSSQLTFIFFRGVETTNQDIYIYGTFNGEMMINQWILGYSVVLETNPFLITRAQGPHEIDVPQKTLMGLSQKWSFLIMVVPPNYPF
jgi:hypothetical protein